MMTATKTSTLLCAATKWEVEPLAKALDLRAAPKGFEGDNVTLIKTGIGAANATQALSPLPKFDRVLSVGFAGALQPGMATGDLVIDIRGADAELPPMARELAATLNIKLHFGKIVDSPSVIASPQDKRALGQKLRASAVDMESAAISQWAKNKGSEFLAVRAILDGVDDALPSGVPEGEDLASLLRFVRKNARELPLLAATGLRQRRAMQNLLRYLPELLKRI